MLPLLEGPRILLWTAAAHAGLAGLCALALTVDAPAIGGVAPALKPLKFAVSICLFLGTMAVFLPSLSLPAWAARTVETLLAGTMAMEMACIVMQAARGTSSHFNTGTPFDAAIWTAMVSAIVVATATMALLAVLACLLPLTEADGEPMSTLLATAWRAGLLLFLLAAASGFSMGGRGAHSIGGVDGGAGLPFLNWSVDHGDLRVAHFWALHALQILPLCAWALEQSRSPWVRVAGLAVAVAAMSLLAGGTLAAGLAGRPFLRRPFFRRSSPVSGVEAARSPIPADAVVGRGTSPRREPRAVDGPESRAALGP